MPGSALADERAAQFLVAPLNRAADRSESVLAPFVIGVTGHRNLAESDLARTRGAVTSFFDTIRQLLPDTDLTLMLGMAAGGDLVVAETALALGIAVEAVLPMPLAKFVVDFDERNRRLLTELLSHRNLRYVELPLPASGAGSLLPNADWRSSAYRNLTEILIQKSNLMLALWDGKASRRPGGTTDTVLRCLRVRADEGDASRLEFTAGDPAVDTDSPFVYWIPVSPGGDDEALSATPPCFLIGLGDEVLKFGSRPPEGLQRRLKEFNDYNRDFGRAAADVRTAPSESLLANVPTDLPLEDRPTLIQINAEYGKADTLALQYQRRSDGLFGMFGVFAFVMGCIYLIYDKLGENPGILLAYLVILLTSLVLYRLLYTKVWFVKHLRYRALAETLRVMFYLRLAGGRSVDAAAVLALSGIEHFEGFGWIGYLLRNIEPVSIAPAPFPDPRCSEYVRKAWVDDQRGYFGRKVKQLEHRMRQVSQWQLAAIVLTVAVLFTRIVFSHAMRSMYVIPGVPLKNLLMLGASVTALMLGAWKLHQSKMATRELIWQYKNQLANFTRSNAELERTATASRRMDLLIELGKRSLMESYLWTIHRYHREHAPPAGA